MILSEEDFAKLFRLPFAEALEFIRQKVPIPTRKWNELLDDEQYNAFTTAGLMQLDILQKMLDSLEAILADGGTIADFVRDAKTALEGSGWAGNNKSRLELIFLQNIQTAYQVGRYEQMVAVADRRPFWQYVAVLDRGTTTTCRGLNDKVFPASSPVWNTIFPPNHFRCRSTVVSISRAEFEAEGLSIADDELAKQYAPADGFRYNPGVQPRQTPPTVEEYAKTLADAFNKLLE